MKLRARKSFCLHKKAKHYTFTRLRILPPTHLVLSSTTSYQLKKQTHFCLNCLMNRNTFLGMTSKYSTAPYRVRTHTLCTFYTRGTPTTDLRIYLRWHISIKCTPGNTAATVSVTSSTENRQRGDQQTNSRRLPRREEVAIPVTKGVASQRGVCQLLRWADRKRGISL
jgi:hypothetical protein